MSERKWKARWISYGQHPKDDLGVFRFRRKFLWSGSGSLPVKVSADQRYQLRVNGHFVGDGPQRGDLQHWFYETYDLAPHLVAGENEIEAVVWSFGRYAPMAQHTYRLAFVMEGEGINTPDGWEVASVDGHDFDMMHNEVGGFYIDIGPGESITLPASELEWRKPNTIVHVLERGEFAGDSPWFVIPRTLPAMRRDRSQGSALVVDRESNDRKPFDTLMIHPGEKVLLDFGELLAAYPRFEFEGTAGTTVKVTYAEGLFDKDGQKNDRNDVRGKAIKGYQDRFLIGGSGSTKQRFEPVWWRTWRYVQIESDRPVRLISHEFDATGYPYEEESSFTADDPWVEKIWDVGVRTAKLCAGETYFDCPYYEQLQYVGDTRIQTLLHYYLSRDRRLARNAVEQFQWSIQPDGLTHSRYPSRVQQIIPGFSLIWTLMLLDSMQYDSAPLDWENLRRDSLSIYEAVQQRWKQPNLPEFWWFLDWAENWDAGIPPNSWENSAFEILAELSKTAHDLLGSNHKPAPSSLQVERERGLVTKVKHAQKPWTSSPPQEHTEALWRCLQLLRGERVDPWPAKELEAAKATRCTYYFQFYKHMAMQSEDYLSELEPWKEMIRNGLTTFAEAPEPTRSDCHAWSAHPLLGFFRQIAGVTSTAKGWKSARIAPRPGRLKEFDAKIAHPDGNLTVRLIRGKIEVDSPVPYEFVWNGKKIAASAGKAQY